MNRRRKVLAAAAFAAPLIVVVAACSFPEVTFSTGQPVNQDGGVDGSTTTSSSSGSTENDGSIPIVLPDGNVIGDEVIDVTPDSGVVVDAAGCDAKCDCDNDGYLKIGCSQLTPADDPDAGKAGGGGGRHFRQERAATRHSACGRFGQDERTNQRRREAGDRAFVGANRQGR